MRPRVIPTLLLSGRRLVKTTKFAKPRYLGDPINAIKIFNDKEVDEIAVLDIDASNANRCPDFEYIAEIASECFIPFTYGGGVAQIEHINRLLESGVDKILINTANHRQPSLLSKASKIFGSQSLVAGIDVTRSRLSSRKVVLTKNILSWNRKSPAAYAKELELLGAGEIFLYSVERDGTYSGYDLELIRSVSRTVGVPIVACGGAGNLEHIASAILDGGASAAAAGSLFVFQNQNQGVLINYPSPAQLKATFKT